MQTIYLISKTGPEWSHPIEAHDDKKAAKSRKFQLNKTLDEKDTLDKLSAYTIADIPFIKTFNIKEAKKRMRILKRNIAATLELEKLTLEILDQNEEWANELMLLEEKADEHNSSK